MVLLNLLQGLRVAWLARRRSNNRHSQTLSSRSCQRFTCRSLVPRISTACHQVIFLAMARKITSCTFIAAPSRPSSKNPCSPWSPTLAARKADRFFSARLSSEGPAAADPETNNAAAADFLAALRL
jgi:hypothetical protein